MSTKVTFIKPSVQILTSAPELRHQLHICELAARVCYDSTDKLTDKVDEQFLERLINATHESVLEHANITMVITTDRATAMQLIRHRLCAYSQQSQRYCRYEAPDEEKDTYRHMMKFIEPEWAKDNYVAKARLVEGLERCVDAYTKMLEEDKMKPEEARCILPNCTATVITVTTNIRQLRHILKMRLTPAAQLPIKLIMKSIKDQLSFCGFGFLLKDIEEDPNLYKHTYNGELPVCTMNYIDSTDVANCLKSNNN